MSRYALAIIILLFPVVANAKYLYGVSANIGEFTINDPDGDTGTASVPYIGLHFITPVSQNYSKWRLFYSFYYRDFELSPTTEQIGQSVSSISFSTSIQKAFDVSEYYRPFVGVGVSVNVDRFTQRQISDDEGFLLKNYDDRDATNVGLLFNAGLNLKKFGKGYYFGFDADYHLSLGSGIDGLSANVFFNW